MRVLHIAQPITPTLPWFAFSRQPYHCAGEGALHAIRCLLRESAAAAPDDTHVVALLNAPHWLQQHSGLELHGTAHIACPLGQPHRAAPGLRRFIATAGPLDAVVCWGANLRHLARRAVSASDRWLEVDMHSGDLHVLDPRHKAAGPSVGRVLPSLPLPSPRAAALRATARARLGVAATEPVIALVSDTACPGSATDLLGAAAMLHVAGVRTTCVLPMYANDIARAQRRVREGTYVQRAVFSHQGSTIAVHAADVAVCAPGIVDALGSHASLAWLANEAARAGTLIVAPDAWIGAWSQNPKAPHPMLISAKAGTPTDLARAIVPLMTGQRHATVFAAEPSPASLFTMFRAAVNGTTVAAR